MTNAVNVEFIVDKLLSYLSEGSSDDHFRSDLVAQITQVGASLPPFIPPFLPISCMDVMDVLGHLVV
jgi:hypothetical protein